MKDAVHTKKNNKKGGSLPPTAHCVAPYPPPRRPGGKKNIRPITGLLIALGLCPGLCAGCVSLMEKAGRALDGSAFAEKTVAVFRSPETEGADTLEVRMLRDRAGEWRLSIALDAFPQMKLRGTAPDASGAFVITSLDFLGGSVSGWNEYRLELSGAGTLDLEADTADFTIPLAPQAVELVSGRIHRYDTRLSGEEALSNLRGRRDRIAALTEWMGAQDGAPKGLSRQDFEKYWKPILLPEMVSPKLRPGLWRQDNDRLVSAEDIRWNTGYTERVFPEELRAVRNSGTLLRDWEEALGWIYLEYEWERITGLLSREHTLQKVK